MKVAVLGADGFLGSRLSEYLSNYYVVSKITRANYHKYTSKKYDIFINAGGNSRRYWADSHPIEDFEASTKSVYQTFIDFKSEQYIYISSADVYDSHSNTRFTKEGARINYTNLPPYGFHKFLSELIVRKYAKSFNILRCCALIGPGLKKGPIKDLMDKTPLHITMNSRLQFIGTREVSEIIRVLIKNGVEKQILNIGGEGSAQISDLAAMLSYEPKISEDARKQVYEMNVNKLKKIFRIKSSKQYARDFLKSAREREL
jgi:nucleoside-diphosphate-sugar epimerase